jgi:hypothetical protein
MLVDKTGLWYRVLAARYCEEAGRVMVGGRRGSPWWQKIVGIRDGVNEEAERGWFSEGVERRVGNGEEMLFGRIRDWVVSLCVGGTSVL